MNLLQTSLYTTYYKGVDAFLDDSKTIVRAAEEASRLYQDAESKRTISTKNHLKLKEEQYQMDKSNLEDEKLFLTAEMNHYTRLLGTTLTVRRQASIKKIKEWINQDADQNLKKLKEAYLQNIKFMSDSATQKAATELQKFEQLKRDVKEKYAKKITDTVKTIAATFDNNYLNSNLDTSIWDAIQINAESTTMLQVESLLQNSKPFSSIQIGTSRYGTTLYEQHFERTFKILLPFLNQGNIMIQYSAASSLQLKDWVNTLTCRLLLANNPKYLYFSLFDIETIGQAFSLFKKVDSDARTMITDKNRMDEQIKKVHQHIQNISTKYLTHHQTIEQYNQHAKSGELGYEIMFIANFPSEFSDETLNLLKSILLNGPKAGVNTILLVDKDRLKNTSNSFRDFDIQGWTGKSCNMCTLDLDNRRLPDAANQLDNHFAIDIFSETLQNATVSYFNEALKATQKVFLPIENYRSKRNDWWQKDSSQQLNVPIGLKKANNLLQYFSFHNEAGDDKGSAALLIGMPGAGKSNLLHTFILNAAIDYSPEMLQLYLLDFSGVEFNIYATNRLPHAKVIAAESDREFGLNVLKDIQNEAYSREQLFAQAGKKHIGEYNQSNPTQKLPRIVLIIDEFQKLFQYRDDIETEVKEIIPQIIQEYRKFGINLILATQTLGNHNVSIPEAVLSLIGIRVALRCQEMESQVILGSGNKEAAKLKQAGEGIYNARLGKVEGNSFFQTFVVGNKEQTTHLLNDIRQLIDYQTVLPQQTLFSGSRQVFLRDNTAFQQQEVLESVYPISVWLGEPMEITKEDAFLKLKRQNQQNILIVGGEEDVALRILSNTVACIINHHAPQSAVFVFFNYMIEESEWYNVPKQYFGAIPFDTHFADMTHSLKYLKQIEKIVKERLKQPHLPKPPIYLTFYNLQGHPRLRYKNKGSELDLFESILREGASVSVHILTQMDTAKNAQNVSSDFIENFNHRIALQMDKTGSQDFIIKDYAAYLLDTSKPKVTKNRALYYNVLIPSKHSKFKPYEFDDALVYSNLGANGVEKPFELFPIEPVEMPKPTPKPTFIPRKFSFEDSQEPIISDKSEVEMDAKPYNTAVNEANETETEDLLAILARMKGHL